MNLTYIKLLFGNQIAYTSAQYYLLLFVGVILYYLFPKKIRWVVLLAVSGAFYLFLFPQPAEAALFGSTILLSWLFGLVIKRMEQGDHRRREMVFAVCVTVTLIPLLLMDITKARMSFNGSGSPLVRLIIPVGLSFYTLQIIAYLADVYQKKIEPQKNPFKYALFISFFPQIMQGPIPRYGDLSDQLTGGNAFDPDNIHRGFQLILWGFFLKMMIADKAMVFVDTVFGDPGKYVGCYVLIAGILYSLQLYADFAACTTLAQGAALLFGVRITDNFHRPYFSVSIKDFWRRWHISLSSWLRDYVYIPLGGNRKGKIRKNINLLITFLVSGFWHGGALHFVAWGLLHGCYQIVGDLTFRGREKLWRLLGFEKDSKIKKGFRIVATSFLVMLAWIIFRADDLATGTSMIRSIFADFNPWILSGTTIYQLGLTQLEAGVLAFSVLILFAVSLCGEKGIGVGEKIMKTPVLFRYFFYVSAILVIMVFGSYGFGFNASDFIYRGF